MMLMGWVFPSYNLFEIKKNILLAVFSRYRSASPAWDSNRWSVELLFGALVTSYRIHSA
jgi:hypothetical protein